MRSNRGELGTCGELLGLIMVGTLLIGLAIPVVTVTVLTVSGIIKTVTK